MTASLRDLILNTVNPTLNFKFAKILNFRVQKKLNLELIMNMNVLFVKTLIIPGHKLE